MPAPKNIPAKRPLMLEGTSVNGLRLGDTAEVVAPMGKKYEGLTGKVTLLDPRVSGVVLEFKGTKEFFLGTDLKKV